MLSTLLRILGDDAVALRRYLWLMLAYGLLCGLAMLWQLPLLQALLAGRAGQAWPYLLAMLGMVALCWLVRYRVEQAGIRVGVAVLRGVRLRLGEHIATLPLGWFSPQHGAVLGHMVTQGLMALAQLPAHVFTPVGVSLLMALLLLPALAWLHAGLALAALLAVLAVLAGMVLASRLARRADATYQQVFADASQRLLEFAHAQAVLRAFNGSGSGVAALHQALQQQRQAGARLIGLSALAAVASAGLLQLLFVGLLWLALSATGTVGQGLFTAGTIMALVLCVRFIEPLQELVGYGEVLRSGADQLQALDALLAEPAMPQPQQLQPVADASLALDGVHFAYGDHAAALEGFSLQVPAGSMTALVGASGSGKSTVLKLLARFYDPQHGVVSIGGVAVNHLPPEQLATLVGYVYQDTYLFSGSIADNILLGKPDASDTELQQAALDAGLDSLLARLPAGLATQVGEGGASLSGGERQRVAIARALVRQTPILLVDEATSALDIEHQAVISQLLQRLRGQRTLLVVSHQLHTVAMADQIVVLEAGRVVECGTPAALLAASGHYTSLVQAAASAAGWRLGSGELPCA